MRRTLSLLLGVLFVLLLTLPTQAGGDAKAALQGVWVSQSLEADGKAAPAEAATRMRFTFKGDKLLIRGNFKDDREEECTFTIDAKKSPKQLDFQPPKETKPIRAIYEIKGDELRVCMRHASSDKGRPTAFESKAGSQLVLIVLKKQKS